MANVAGNLQALLEYRARTAPMADAREAPHEPHGDGHPPFDTIAPALLTTYDPANLTTKYPWRSFGMAVISGPAGGVVRFAAARQVAQGAASCPSEGACPIGAAVRWNRGADYVTFRATIAGTYTIVIQRDRFTYYEPWTSDVQHVIVDSAAAVIAARVNDGAVLYNSGVVAAGAAIDSAIFDVTRYQVLQAHVVNSSLVTARTLARTGTFDAAGTVTYALDAGIACPVNTFTRAAWGALIAAGAPNPVFDSVTPFARFSIAAAGADACQLIVYGR